MPSAFSVNKRNLSLSGHGAFSGDPGLNQGSTSTDTNTGRAQGQDGFDGDDDDDDNVFPVTSLRHGLHHLAPVCLTERCRSMGSKPKGVATLFYFEQRAVQDHGVAPLFRTCPGTKEATSKTCRREHQQLSRQPPKREFMLRVCLCLWYTRACVCAGMPACLCDACLLASVQSLATGHRAHWSSSKQALVELVEAGPRVITPQRSPYWEGVGSVVLRARGGCHASI